MYFNNQMFLITATNEYYPTNTGVTGNTRKPYGGLSRSLVIAIDVGTTFSGVSYAILEPGEIPKIHGATRFPGQEHVKILSVIYYDKHGAIMAAGAEADSHSIVAQAEDNGWIKAEKWNCAFKLRLRPRQMQLNMNGMRHSPLPRDKSHVHVFGDYLNYLYSCTRSFISDTHANSAALLVRDSDEGRTRIHFVTEGEASLHACVLSGLAGDNPSKHGFLIADAGGGMLDISSYVIKGTPPLFIEEIAPPDCIFAGLCSSADALEKKLKHSKYRTADSLDHITRKFDETTKRLFRNRNDLQFILFGSPLGRSVFLVGGYAASPWLFGQLQERLVLYNINVSRPNTQTLLPTFHCHHHVLPRMSKFMYGVEFLREFDPNDVEHLVRKEKLCELPFGPKLLPDAFDCILARSVKVKESTVFTRKYCTELFNLSMLSVFEVQIWCYRGGNVVPKWIN
ncbi:hypothetical protein HYPSUDRAFT_1079859 [Hypholoma sublateritium FD-334 SS-4]|uniref:Uncharacterized protein n=1 Tax=Hypholoma sublateritium (strain FD-334 SS-4) TaxID=945553 RepID=A0A0D2PW90_HYPSF|nr:hypothetical protein HYPSUDRAFT_1079859 [Hypholoma sublateritium FD-334 SS-4]